jgi:putative peptidoglycan lipid II flippase
MQKATSSASSQIARAAGTIVIPLVAGQVIGLLAKILATSAFGIKGPSEAFFAANRFTDILFQLVAGGALGSAFIPTFTGFLTHEDRKGAWRLFSGLLNLVTLILTLLAIFSAIFAPWVVNTLLAPGFSPQQQVLTAELLRIQLFAPIIFGCSGLVMGALNAHRVFLYPALAPSMYQLGWIFGIIVLGPWLGIYGLAWGVVAGALLHLAIQIPALLRLPARQYTFSFGLDNPAVREVARLMAPRLLGVAVIQLNFWLNTYLASLQSEGSVTGVTLGFTLMLMPQAAIAQSVAIAALPTFSAQAAQGKLEEMRASLANTLRGVLLLAIPASLGLMMLSLPIVSLVYERGKVTSDSTSLVAWALLWYAAGLVGHCGVEILSRAFYALHDTKTPVTVTTLAMALNLGLSLVFSALFTRIGWMPHGGLALANSLATALEMVGLLVLMRRRLNGLGAGRIWQAVWRALLGAASMGLSLWLWLSLTAGRPGWLVAIGGILIGGGLYLIILILLKVEEIGALWVLVNRRLLKR